MLVRASEAGLYNVQIHVISKNKLFIAHRYKDSNGLVGFIYVLNDNFTDGTAHSSIALSSEQYTTACKRISENEIIVFYCSSSGLHCGIFRINDNNTLTKTYENIIISENLYSSVANRFTLQVELTSSKKAFIVYTKEDDARELKLYSCICKINVDNTVELEINSTKLTEIKNSYLYAKSVKLTDNLFFIAHGGVLSTEKSKLYCTMYGYDIQTTVGKLQNSNDKILGVAKKKGVAGQLIPVTVPFF